MPSTHTSIVRLDDGREIFTSYGVPVAGFIPADVTRCTCPVDTKTGECQGQLFTDCPQHGARRLPNVSGWVRTVTRYSVTTSRHVRQYMSGEPTTTVPADDWVRLVSPLVVPEWGS